MKSLSLAILALVNNASAIQIGETWTPAQSRELFEKQVAEAAQTVATERSIEAQRTAATKLLNDNDIRETFNEKARVRAGQIAQQRGGPSLRYWKGPAAPAKAASLAQGDAPEAAGPWNPAQSRKMFDEHVKTAAAVVAEERRIEAERTAATKLLNENDIIETFNEKARVRAGQIAQQRGGPSLRYWKGPAAPAKAASLAQGDAPAESGPWNPAQSRKVFDEHVKTAAAVVAEERRIEAARTAATKLLNDNDIRETFNEKARVRAGQIAMQRGGPSRRYWNAPPPAKAASLAQLISEEPVKAKDIGEPQVEPTVYHFVSDNVDALPHDKIDSPSGLPNTLTGY